ncbi:MAG: hypothetical protein Q4C60_05200 [Eubacteriales bacterium]|nr:hypothetical protein [Eubacteriales bacterium]
MCCVKCFRDAQDHTAWQRSQRHRESGVTEIATYSGARCGRDRGVTGITAQQRARVSEIGITV